MDYVDLGRLNSYRIFYLFELHHLADIFSDDVEFQIDNRAFLYLAEVGMVVCIRDNCHRQQRP